MKDAVGRGHLPIAASLPFVVYATEIGYDYSGDEYWQTFSQQTPGWSNIEDRDFIRQGFQRFAEQRGSPAPRTPACTPHPRCAPTSTNTSDGSRSVGQNPPMTTMS